jgi:hypothetical protein
MLCRPEAAASRLLPADEVAKREAPTRAASRRRSTRT